MKCEERIKNLEDCVLKLCDVIAQGEVQTAEISGVEHVRKVMDVLGEIREKLGEG